MRANAGTILLGVSNTGDLNGLEIADSAEGRDELLRRVEGVCRGTIKPAVTPNAKYAVEADKTVLVLTVPKGRQPIYYSNNIPYVRHITESRPAEPYEVLELVRSYLVAFARVEGGEEQNATSELLSELAQMLINILIYADEVKERQYNPWLELWKTEFRYAASESRDLAARKTAIEEKIAEDLLKLADSLDQVANFRMYMGCGNEFGELVESASALTRRLKVSRVDSVRLSDQSVNQIKELISASVRKLEELTTRAESMANSGRLEDLQSEASAIGLRLLKLSYYKIDSFPAETWHELQSIARDLHLIETIRIYMDGGVSLNSIINKVAKCSEKLEVVSLTLS
jgi:hypothetical protein